MRAIVIGGGSVGMFCAMALARRGEEVTVVDRDPGPPASGPWARRGVMQYRLPHFFRSIVRDTMTAELPDVWQTILDAGGIEATRDGLPAVTQLQCRRSTFERAVSFAEGLSWRN